MKKIIVRKLIILSLLIIGINTTYAQSKYDKFWTELESLELEGKFQSANILVDRILKKARQSNQSDQIVKGFIYKSKFTLLLEEEAQSKIISELEASIEESDFPTNALLESIYASYLQQYLNKNRYKIRRRTKLDKPLQSEDFEKWDINTLELHIAQHYEMSLSNPKGLKKLAINDFKEVLTESKTSHKFRPTLYDFLAHRVLKFYTLNKWDVSMPKQRFYVNNPLVFKPTQEFAMAPFITSDNLNSKRQALTLYQQLESFHELLDTTAYVDVVLARLKFAKDYSSIKNKNDLYLKALLQLSDRFKKHASSAIIDYNIANSYFKSSKKINAKRDSVLKGYRIKALDICSKTIKKYANSDGGLLCAILKKNIKKESVSIKAEKYIVPGESCLARVRFKGVDSLCLSAYKLPFDYTESRYSYKRDSIILQVIKERKPVQSKLYKLQVKKDYYQYTTELDFPSLPIGNYLLVSSKNKEITSIDQIYSHASLCVSNLSMLTINRNKSLVIKILDRQNGSPQKDVEITIENKKAYSQTGKTNEKGEFQIKKDNTHHNFKILAVRDNDTLIDRRHYLSGYYKRVEREDHIAKMFLYLDRSIYRPGQTVYFKGILVEDKHGKSSVVPNTFTSIIIYDTNYEELKEFRLKTNSFGSVSGEFKLPRNLLNGEFNIVMEEDYGTDTEDEDSYYDHIDDVECAEVPFSVEEYKRPKFEVIFNAITENYRIGDSIKVSGYAKAFLGSTVSDAQVKYSVSRDAIPVWNRNFYGKAPIIKTGTTETGSEGKFTIAFIATPDSLSKKSDKSVFLYTVKADITDSNGETRTASKTVRVGYHNLKIDLSLANKLNGSIPQKIKIETKNLNDQTVEAEVEVAIDKLTSPERVLRKKPWEIVEVQSIPKDKFIELFPHEAYDKTDVKKNWKKGKQVFSNRIEASKLKEFTLNNMSQWESGVYNIELKAIDTFQDTVITNKQFEVYHPDNKLLSDNQLFEYEIVNSDFKKDQFVVLKLKTACKELNVNLEAYYKEDLVYSKLVTITNGYAIVKVPVSKAYKNKMDFNLYFAKFNSMHRDHFSVNFIEAENKLKIETLSFRNKLLPGQKETWSFKITDSDNKNANAEVLASMYDTSLDQFKNHSWNTNVGFSKGFYSRAPRVYSDFFGTNTFFSFNYRRAYNPTSVLKNYHKLRWFGFNFGSSDDANKQYLRRLINKRANPQYKQGNINGTVTDETGLPIPGVSVNIKGTRKGVVTDIDGFYSISAPQGSVLTYSFVGLVSQSIVITKSGTFNVAMASEMFGMDEVVVTAMGVAHKKRSLTGSVVYVNARDVVRDIERQLGGKAAGVDILENAGGVGNQILLRGMRSVSGDNSALIIIDGVPMDANSFDKLSPHEIAGITVLKGAEATSLYGARAQNGALIVSTKRGLEELSQVEVRSNLKETAFFYPHLRTNKNGEVIFSFDSPEALTKWRLMLLAHNKSLETGALEKVVVTQKNINVIPNAPRFLREDDTITLSAKISNLTKETLAGVAALQLFDGVTMDPIAKELISFESTKNFKISAKGNSSVAWRLKIPKGISALQYKIVAKSGTHSDGEMSVLPVLSNRSLVTEARPLWVPAGKSKEVQFEKLKQAHSETQTNHKFTLEYTSNPAWVAIKSLPYLMDFPYECAEQTFSRFYSNALAEVIIAKNPKIEEVLSKWKSNNSLQSSLEKNEELKSVLLSESPWVRDLQSDKENKARLAGLFDKEKVKSQQLQTISKLKELQLASGGFPWFAGGRENRFITQHIIAGIGHLRKLDIKCENDYRLNPLLKKAIAYLDTEFVNQYKESLEFKKNPKDLSLNHYVLHYLYSRSFFMDKHPLSDRAEKITNLYLQKSKESWLTQSLYNKGMIALILHRRGDNKTAEVILEALSEQAVNNEENGMYWKANRRSWYWYQSPIETQALLIEAFTEINGDLKKVERLKQWLLKNKQTNKWSTTKATTEAIYALLMHGNDYLSISDNTLITVGNKKISTKKLDATKKEAGTGYLKVSWNEKEINSRMASVKIANKSGIVGFGGVYWQYFEDLDKIQSSGNSPLSLKKSIFIKETTNNGDILVPITSKTAIKLGDLITVRLVVESKNDMEFVHLKDLRASGLEPVDVLSEYKWQDGLGYYQSTKDVATHFFFDELPKGTYVFEYDLRANNRGHFSNGNSTIQSMYAPEFNSNSKGIRLIID